MSKTNQELAVELVIAQIQASASIKIDNLKTGRETTSDTICKLLTRYYTTLKSLDEIKE